MSSEGVCVCVGPRLVLARAIRCDSFFSVVSMSCRTVPLFSVWRRSILSQFHVDVS